MSETLKEPFLTLQHRAFSQPNETAFVFVGQGIQQVGFGSEIFDYSPVARRVYETADRVVAGAGYSISDISFNGPKETLDLTRFSQPAILTYNHAYYETIKDELGSNFKNPAAVCGYSLGELSAICAAGSVSFEQMLQVVDSRGDEMQKICDARGGGKILITIRVKGEQGLSLGHRIIFARAIRYLVSRERSGERLYVGAINNDVSINLGGDEQALQNADRWLKEYKRRDGNGEIIWKRLNVRGPFHTPDMQPAEKGVNEVVDSIDVVDPQILVIANTDGGILDNAQSIRAEIGPHIYLPVRMYKSIRVLYKRGVKFIVEPGNRAVVSSMIQGKDQIILPVKGDEGRGITLAHILMPKDEL